MAATQTPAPLLLAVGHYGGAIREESSAAEASDQTNSGAADAAASADAKTLTRHEVRRGGELIELPDDVFRVWTLSHCPPDWPHDKRWTRETMLERAHAAGVADVAADTLDDLLGERLATEVRPGAPSSREVARAFHIHPTMLGLGNTSESANTFALGFVGAPLVQVSRTIFELWRWAPVERSMWDLCRFFAETERDHGVTDPDRTDPDVVLAGLLETLPTLISSGAVYLDLAE